MTELFLPVLHSFENENIFTGSFGNMRFRVIPMMVFPNGGKVADIAASTMLCEVWYGPFCYEKSEIEATNEFPISQEGYDAMRAWLNEQIKGA